MQNVGNRLKEICNRCGQEYPEGTRFCPVDASELMLTMVDPMIGMVLPRRYRILAPLGRGAMSVVYKGSYEPLDQLVAVKMLKTHLVGDLHNAKRFQQEIKTAGSLNHPNIATILDFGVTEQGVPYLIMEYLEGKTLGMIIEREERLSVNRTVQLFTQAARGFGYAHTMGVIHRDIKPNNLMVIDTDQERDIVKIVDFGIAKVQQGGAGSISGDRRGITEDHPAALTSTGEVLGTPLYMSPEQSLGKELDGRSDIYALGCVLYQALTGKPPFQGETVLETIRMQVSSVPQSIEQARPDLFFPERLQQVVTRCLAKDPRMRYQRMEHLAEDLENCARRSENSMSSVSGIRAIPTELDGITSGSRGIISGSRATMSSGCAPVYASEETQRVSRPFDLTALSLPMLCGIVGVLIAMSVVIWAVVTDVGKKEPAPVRVSLPITQDSDWRRATDDAQNAFTAGNYAQSELAYNDALSIAKKFKQPDARVARTLNALAFVYDAEDKPEAAESASRNALMVAEQLNPAEPSLTADSLSNLCRISCDMGNDAAAEKFGMEALKLSKQAAAGKPQADVAMAMRALSQVECRKGQYKTAESLLLQALNMVEKAEGKDHPDVASITNDLGMVREKQGNLKSAEELFNRALGIRQQHFGVDHPSVADTLCALGTLNFNNHKDQAAEALFNNALSIRQKTFGEDSSRVAEVYSCLAILYDTDRKYQQAEECYRKTFEVRQKLWGANSPRLVRSLSNLARFLREHNQPRGAEIYEAQIRRIEGH